MNKFEIENDSILTECFFIPQTEIIFLNFRRSHMLDMGQFSYDNFKAKSITYHGARQKIQNYS